MLMHLFLISWVMNAELAIIIGFLSTYAVYDTAIEAGICCKESRLLFLIGDFDNGDSPLSILWCDSLFPSYLLLKS